MPRASPPENKRARRAGGAEAGADATAAGALKWARAPSKLNPTFYRPSNRVTIRLDGFAETRQPILVMEGSSCTSQPNNRYESMRYNRVGRSGLKLPAVSLGLWHNFGGVDTLENGRAMLRRAFDLGITHFDLANNYGPPPGSAEENFRPHYGPGSAALTAMS